MTTEPQRPLSRHDAERLLGSGAEQLPAGSGAGQLPAGSGAGQLPAGSGAGQLPAGSGTETSLAGLLAAAAAPATARELSGERAALVAFRASRASSADPSRSPSMLHSWLTRLAAAKVLAGAVATTAVCGVALAATTGSLPGPFHVANHGVAGQHQPSVTPTPAHGDGDGDADDSPTAHPTGTGWHTPHALSPAQIAGLCRIWLVLPQLTRVHFHGERGDRLTDILAKVAGGEAKVESYCIALVGKPPVVTPPKPGQCPVLPWPLPKDFPTARPTVHPTGHPTGWPTVHPTARPTDRPSGRPTDWPTTRPTSIPTTWPTITWGPCPTPWPHPTGHPTGLPTGHPTIDPTGHPTLPVPTKTRPTGWPSLPPTGVATTAPARK